MKNKFALSKVLSFAMHTFMKINLSKFQSLNIIRGNKYVTK